MLWAVIRNESHLSGWVGWQWSLLAHASKESHGYVQDFLLVSTEALQDINRQKFLRFMFLLKQMESNPVTFGT